MSYLGSRTHGATGATGPTGGTGPSDIEVGTTTIAGGTDTHVLFNNNGVVGEYAISGTGDVVMTSVLGDYVLTSALSAYIPYAVVNGLSDGANVSGIQCSTTNSLSIYATAASSQGIQIQTFDAGGTGGAVSIGTGNGSGAGFGGNIFLNPGGGADDAHAGHVEILNATSGKYLKIHTDLLTGDRNVAFPDASGTVALETAASGSFLTADAKTITVVNGIITSIV